MPRLRFVKEVSEGLDSHPVYFTERWKPNDTWAYVNGSAFRDEGDAREHYEKLKTHYQRGSHEVLDVSE